MSRALELIDSTFSTFDIIMKKVCYLAIVSKFINKIDVVGK